jgi:hypothetical protein
VLKNSSSNKTARQYFYSFYWKYLPQVTQQNKRQEKNISVGTLSVFSMKNKEVCIVAQNIMEALDIGYYG